VHCPSNRSSAVIAPDLCYGTLVLQHYARHRWSVLYLRDKCHTNHIWACTNPPSAFEWGQDQWLSFNINMVLFILFWKAICTSCMLDRTCVQRYFGAVTTRMAAERHQKSAKGHGLCTKSAPCSTQEYLNALFPAQWVWYSRPFFWPSWSPQLMPFNFSYGDISDLSSAIFQ